MVGNVYLGRVQNVLPSMEAAFVDIGKGRNAVLYAGEVNWDAAGLGRASRKRIEHALKSGEPVLVQVTKDPIGHKGARLTSQISPARPLPGLRARRLDDRHQPQAARHRAHPAQDDPQGGRPRGRRRHRAHRRRGRQRGGAAPATSSGSRRSGRTSQSKAEAPSTRPALLYGEPDLTVRVVRDIFNEDFAKLVVSGDDAWDTVAGLRRARRARPRRPASAAGRARTTSSPRYRVDEQIAKALDRKVWLPSGGSLVIDRTEAMTVVDVNTGKFTGSGGNLEETVTKNNLEAAEEIVRQLRLRDIGGIIVIDFIDMVLETNRDLVLRRLVECLGRDRTKHQVAEVTSLGLVQMTRKRVGPGPARGVQRDVRALPRPRRDRAPRAGRRRASSTPPRAASTASARKPRPAKPGLRGAGAAEASAAMAVGCSGRGGPSQEAEAEAAGPVPSTDRRRATCERAPSLRPRA